jgi:hypothetical protein
MSSNINPNDIDGTYPVAGQDNNSQGFRDNFTNIKSNFQYAEDEINDLQSKVILKAALTGTVLDNNMGGSLLYNAQVQDISLTRLALGTVSGSTTIDYALSSYQTMTLGANTSLAFTNFPAAGAAGVVRIQVTVGNTAYTLTLPAAVSVGVTGIEGISSNVITFATAGVFEFEFTTSNGGTTITVADLNRPNNYYSNPIFLASSQDLANGAAASLVTTASYFSTSAAETATLNAGTDGQIKTFMMRADSGDMVITVTNPGWGGAGTITFTAIGQGCTLQYINSKWFCIGNNGATFA